MNGLSLRLGTSGNTDSLRHGDIVIVGSPKRRPNGELIMQAFVVTYGGEQDRWDLVPASTAALAAVDRDKWAKARDAMVWGEE